MIFLIFSKFSGIFHPNFQSSQTRAAQWEERNSTGPSRGASELERKGRLPLPLALALPLTLPLTLALGLLRWGPLGPQCWSMGASP